MSRKNISKRDSGMEKSFTEFIIDDKKGSIKGEVNNFGFIEKNSQKGGFYINSDITENHENNQPAAIELTTVQNETIGYSGKNKSTAIHLKININ